MSMECAEIDVINKVELCALELMADKEDTTCSRAQRVLGQLSTSPEHLFFCLKILQEKVAAEKEKDKDNWSLYIKLLPILAENYHLLESIPGMKDQLFLILEKINATTSNSFLQSYAKYLIYTLWQQPIPDDASDFKDLFPAMQIRIGLLTQCTLDTTSDAYVTGLALCGVDFLVRDGYHLYQYLRKGMDKLLDNIVQAKDQSLHMQALSVGEELGNFLSFAREMAESHFSDHVANPNAIKKEQVTQLAATLDNIQKQLKTMAYEQQKLAIDVKDIKIMHHTKDAIQAEGSGSISQIHEESNKLRRLMRHDIKSIVDARAFKTDAKVDKLDRHIGAFHEKLCRVLLGRNIAQLVGEGFNDLEGFQSFHAQLSKSFVCVVQICTHLQLNIDEQESMRVQLMQNLGCLDMGRCVFRSFLQVLQNELEKKYSVGKWPKFARKIKENVGNLLEQSEPSDEMVQKLKVIGEMVKQNFKADDDCLKLLGNDV